MALSSPLFTQEREDATSRRRAYHSHDEGLSASQSCRSSNRTTCCGAVWFTNPTRQRKSAPQLGKWANQDSSGTTESRFSLIFNQPGPIMTEEVSKSWVKWSSLKEEKFIVLIMETNNIDEINNFFMNSDWSKIWIFVKRMIKASVRWKLKRFLSRVYIRYNFEEEIGRRSRYYPWTHTQDSETTNEVYCMNDSRDFKDAESVRSGQSHVASQPAFSLPFQNPGGMLSRFVGMPSRNDKQTDIWDTHGLSGNVFVNPLASSSAPYPRVEPMEL